MQDRQPEGFAEWMKWHSSTKQTEGGKIIFQYTQLSELKKDLLPEPSPHADLSEKVKMISVKKTYETDIITLFHATGDFNYRVHWLEGLKTVDEVDHFLPRVGMKCKYVKNSGEKLIVRASSYMYSENRIEFSETPEDEMTSICYTLEK